MSRLFVESNQSTRSIRTLTEQPPSGAKGYFEKVAKLVPSEVIAGFLAMCGFVPNMEADSQQTTYWVLVIFCLVLTPLYLNFQAEKEQPRVVHLLISTVAFAVWAYVTKGDVLFNNFSVSIASIVLVAFSLVSGLIPLRK